jgi:hypothetical protein
VLFTLSSSFEQLITWGRNCNQALDLATFLNIKLGKIDRG